MLLLCPSPEEKPEKNGKSFVIMEIERPLEISENFVIDPYIIAVVETHTHSQTESDRSRRHFESKQSAREDR